MRNKWISGVALCMTFALVLTGCGAQDNEITTSHQQGVSNDSYGSVLSGEITEAIANIKTKEADYDKAVYVELDGTKALISSIGNVAANIEVGETATNGLSLANGVLCIGSAGDYVLSGEFEGQVQVNADKEDKVHLILNGVSIHCADSGAIYGAQSDRIYITLAEGTVNEVSDGTVYVYEEEGQDEPNAAIFSKDDLTFDGTGSLVVKGNYGDGIRSKDDLAIVGGNYEVEAVKDGLQGKDSVCITSGNFILKVGSDAIKSSNDTEEEKGYVVIDGGTFSIQAEDDGVHGESGLLINDCKMDILNCYEGLEAKVIEINGGEISIVASDDGLNAAYGSTDETSGEVASDAENTDTTDTTEDAGWGRGQKGGFGGFSGDAGGGKGSMIPDANCKIAVNGGAITVSAGGDGIDSNGSFYVTGGEVYVNSSPRGADGALDCGTEAIVTGGVVVALGASGMATGFSQESSQCFILYNMNTQAVAGEKLSLVDKEGQELLSYTPTDAYNSVLVSCPDMVADGTYTLKCGEQEMEITLSGNFYSDGGNGFGGFGDFGGGKFGGFGGDDQGKGNGGFGGGRGNRGDENATPPEGMTPPEGWEEGQMPSMPEMPEGMTPPEGWEEGQMPQMPSMPEMPEEEEQSSTGDVY
ncbi:MAG: carbohydrate-binding domain-containing protein [Lachnospiraceae bacterium]|nr:carbohydrate-binding domain-containing protein [Lachnospiraceae bacterium]